MHHRFIPVTLFLLVSISLKAQVTTLSPNDFYNRLKTVDNPQLFDLRNDTDFGVGHVKKAVNFDYNSEGFESFLLGNFDQNQPLFIYCYAGIRSSQAKTYISELGFKNVIELEKGFANWTASSKPYVSSQAFTKPIAAFTTKDFEREIRTTEILLVDFYADWCGPCKKMKPILQKIARENPHVKLLQVDADKSEDIVNAYKVNEIPTLILFKNGQQNWRDSGIKTERELRNVIQ
jgi:thioredoxin